jgi:hypothetical protein
MGAPKASPTAPPSRHPANLERLDESAPIVHLKALAILEARAKPGSAIRAGSDCIVVICRSSPDWKLKIFTLPFRHHAKTLCRQEKTQKNSLVTARNAAAESKAKITLTEIENLFAPLRLRVILAFQPFFISVR